ncbi:MAG TPA: peptidoglycan DD-metalloendopeptidase family protein [Pseudolabrys sp.]|nr:peptidoglycan DD-metalloendopeptidase family protein [Pseudolabrys sp.]
MIASACAVALVLGVSASNGQDRFAPNGAVGAQQGLLPHYPAGKDCSPITSTFASLSDVDGSRRDEPHSGIDAGRLGEPIYSPAAGVVMAAWQANWGWGREGALIVRHTRSDLGLTEGPEFYYSEFDHLRYRDIRALTAGQRVERGEHLANVFRPGGKPRYLPEVHWEVWSVDDDDATVWRKNEFGRNDWFNQTASLVDPLSLLSLDAPRKDGTAEISPFEAGRNYRDFRGFTYILPCKDKRPPSSAAN